MLFFYNTGIFLYSLIVKLLASYNTKARLFTEGRRDLIHRIQNSINKEDQHIWFHFASLGEFEQGRTVLEACKKHFPSKKIVLTFFSPSGYEIRKDYAYADYVFYLPLDTKSNAQAFIDTIQPEFVVFTKYDFWYHYFKYIKDRDIPLYLVAGTFRPNQAFFKWYGSFFREILKKVDFFFLQDSESGNLLDSIGLKNHVCAGDTRFDRVVENAANVKSNPIVDKFTNNAETLVCGSTWPPDEVILSEAAIKFPNLKFIIAPHEVKKSRITEIESQFPKSLRYSVAQNNNLEDISNFQTLVIDNIGMLSSIYPYGYLSYIGGGFGTGLHNTQEPAAFGKSVIVGPDHIKFKEVAEMINLGTCKSISTAKELIEILETKQLNLETGKIAKNFIQSKSGATQIVMSYLSNKHHS